MYKIFMCSAAGYVQQSIFSWSYQIHVISRVSENCVARLFYTCYQIHVISRVSEKCVAKLFCTWRVTIMSYEYILHNEHIFIQYIFIYYTDSLYYVHYLYYLLSEVPGVAQRLSKKSNFEEKKFERKKYASFIFLNRHWKKIAFVPPGYSRVLQKCPHIRSKRIIYEYKYIFIYMR